MREITVSSIERCPIRSLRASHYRADGSCLCVPQIRGYLHELTCPGPEECRCEKVEAVVAWIS